ncbi:hypothetical protein RhiJN_06530 [Ceratobasidium sp. AG-Ba]|nr:hypothetical protein RhiJN_06530 [Ceratobasidium sp. AG-Ba]
MNTRTTTLLAKRNIARKGTLIAGEEFDPVFAKAAHSPQYIDPIKKNHVIRIEPEWISKEAVRLKAGADLLSRLNDKRDNSRIPQVQHPHRKEADIMPDTHGFTKSIGEAERIYLDEPPEWPQLQFKADSAAPSRPISHSISTHAPSPTNGPGTVQEVTKTGP